MTFLTRIMPEYARIDLLAPGADAQLARWYETDAAVRLNMITSLTGSAVGSDGTSDTLTSPADRSILRAIRAAADVVVVGAQSVRAEGYISPRTARLAVVTASGDLRGHRLQSTADTPAPIVFCPTDRLAAVREHLGDVSADVHALPSVGGGGLVSPRDVISALAGLKLTRAVCEGGPMLASAFLRAGVIDEACVTVAPTLTPAESPFVSLRKAAATEVRALAADEAGFTYLRLAVR